LLGFIEAVNFINEQYGSTPILSSLLPGYLNSLTNLLYTGKNRRDRLEMSIADFSQQTRQCRLADTWWAPENHGMQRALLQCFSQRFSSGKQMLLANVFVQGGGTHTSSQRLSHWRCAE